MKHQYRTYWLFTCFVLLAGCTVSYNSENSKDMLYKLYVVTNKVPASDAQGLELFNEFKGIYADHGVRVVGVWENADDDHEIYFMTAFEDDAHYERFVESMKSNEDYQRMSKVLEEEREGVKSVNLKMSVDL